MLPVRLTKRSEYLEVARGARTPRRGFLLQSIARRSKPGVETVSDLPPRFGFTVTKKIGNAVERNRIRRRLKEAVRLEGVLAAKPGTDYVLIGRGAALEQPFADLVADVVGAIRAAGRGAKPAGRHGPEHAGTAGTQDAEARKRPVDG